MNRLHPFKLLPGEKLKALLEEYSDEQRSRDFVAFLLIALGVAAAALIFVLLFLFPGIASAAGGDSEIRAVVTSSSGLGEEGTWPKVSYETGIYFSNAVWRGGGAASLVEKVDGGQGYKLSFWSGFGWLVKAKVEIVAGVTVTGLYVEQYDKATWAPYISVGSNRRAEIIRLCQWKVLENGRIGKRLPNCSEPLSEDTAYGLSSKMAEARYKGKIDEYWGVHKALRKWTWRVSYSFPDTTWRETHSLRATYSYGWLYVSAGYIWFEDIDQSRTGSAVELGYTWRF